MTVMDSLTTDPQIRCWQNGEDQKLLDPINHADLLTLNLNNKCARVVRLRLDWTRLSGLNAAVDQFHILDCHRNTVAFVQAGGGVV